jgi:geranylgeranyl diphosphate synthase type I
MLSQLKKRIDRELGVFIKDLNRQYALRALSGLLYESIKDFVLRDGKRIRPIIFVIGYLGYAKRAAPGLYRSAVSIELLHDFMLIHDDIIDKSETRRGKPSMHALLNAYLKKHDSLKFNGQDLSIVVGDVIYAMAIESFLAIKEKPARKEEALRNFIKTAAYTAAGEFIDVLGGADKISRVQKNSIYKIYDYKTAYYTFSCPLSTGAMLAGAPRQEIALLADYGLYLGRAFQIKDDIMGLFGDEKRIGKSTLSDLQEAKKTLLIWRAYKNADKKDKKNIEKILSASLVTKKDLKKMQSIIIGTGSLAYAKREIVASLEKAQQLVAASKIKLRYKKILLYFGQKLLAL